MRAGFTLFELLVVLAILGLAIALFETRGPGHSATLDLRAASEQVAQGLNEARSRAMASGRPSLVILDAGHQAWRIDGDKPHPLPNGTAITAGPGSIRFAPDGSNSGARITLAAGVSRRVVALSWLTGRVSIDDAPPQ